MRAFVGNTIGQRPGERGVRQTPRSPVLRLHGREDQSEGQVPSRGVDVREPKFDGADMSEVVVMSKADAVGASFKGYPFGGLEANKLGYSSARGGAVVGCGGIATLGANVHGCFLPGTWVAF